MHAAAARISTLILGFPPALKGAWGEGIHDALQVGMATPSGAPASVPNGRDFSQPSQTTLLNRDLGALEVMRVPMRMGAIVAERRVWQRHLSP